MRFRRASFACAATFVALGSISVVSCSKPLAQEDCDHFLGQGTGLAAFPTSAVVPVDVANLRARARGDVKRAIDDFDRACLGAMDSDQVLCARRAKTTQDFVKCGEITRRARESGEVAQLAIVKKHNADECARYAEHAVQIRAATVDDAGKLVHECDDWMEIGVYRCRVAARDPAGWRGCE